MQFDREIHNAIEFNKLVVFAGAGVSMGPPSSLPDFGNLVLQIARKTVSHANTTRCKLPNALDHFLGDLEHQDVNVRTLAASALSPPGSKPNELHMNLLKLFRKPEQVRVVTTNFDLHFSAAAKSVFGETPRVFEAPALPLGHDFNGIVHVHGSLRAPQNMVLTDRDFGRAYLTEGWARRFLLDLFQTYTVLFVGYSHNDLVMTYLSRALPVESKCKRYAADHKEGTWDFLGIKRVPFGLGPDGSFQELYDGIQRLADLANRGALGWRARLAQLCQEKPPADALATDEIEIVLNDEDKIDHFVRAARRPEWLEWLNKRGYLSQLFAHGTLDSQGRVLARWVAEQFAVDHAEAIFALFSDRSMDLNPTFWNDLSRELSIYKGAKLDKDKLRRWATILLSTASTSIHPHGLMWLAELCAEKGLLGFALDGFLLLGTRRIHFESSRALPTPLQTAAMQSATMRSVFQAEHYHLHKVWSKCLKPNLTVDLADKLIISVATLLTDQHKYASAWDGFISTKESSYRYAIEPHKENVFRGPIDVLIDSVRDALTYLHTAKPGRAMYWIGHLAASEVLLLKRVGTYVAALYSPMTADERLKWLLNSVGLHDVGQQYEVYQAVIKNYVDADDNTRRLVIDAILDYKLSSSSNGALDAGAADETEARVQFNWLYWLLEADPNCGLAREALAPIEAMHPMWTYKPVSMQKTGEFVLDESPWSVEQLLTSDPGELRDDLLRFKQTDFDGPTRYGLLHEVRKACNRAPKWGLGLARSLLEHEAYTSDLWPHIVYGWQDGDPAMDERSEIIELMADLRLFKAHPGEITGLLGSLLETQRDIQLVQLIAEINETALKMWRSLELEPVEDDHIDDLNWIDRAVNHPAGKIVKYWLESLSMLVQHAEEAPLRLPKEYRKWFGEALKSGGITGNMARALLSSHVHYLYHLDSSWTAKHILPLLEHSNSAWFRQAWDGFLTWGRVTLQLAPLFDDIFRWTISRINDISEQRRNIFVGRFVQQAVFHVRDDEIMPFINLLFQYGSTDDFTVFAQQVERILSQMESQAVSDLWGRWLQEYWQNRLHGLPVALNEVETQVMLTWLAHLGDEFPRGVRLAIQFAPGQIGRSNLLYELRTGDLVERFPEDVARLLIYLADWDLSYWTLDMQMIAERLPDLPLSLCRELNEALVGLGLDGLDACS